MPSRDRGRFQQQLTVLLAEYGVPYRKADSLAEQATEGWIVTHVIQPEERPLSADEIVEEHWPYDGPHTSETVTTAAHAVERLVRYVNNATQPVTAERTLRYAATVNRVLGNITAAVYGLQQLLDQQEIALELQAGNPTLYDDRRDRPGSTTAIEAAEVIASSKVTLGELTARLDQVLRLTVHLGNDE